MAQTPEEIIAQYDQAVTEARVAYENAATRLNQAQEQLDAIPEPADVSPGSPGEAQALQRKQLQQRIDTLQKAYGDAQQQYTTVLRQRADATNRAKSEADPATAERLKAQAEADSARAEQIRLEADEFREAAPERRQAAKDKARLAKLEADEAEYNLTVLKETDPIKKEAAKAALDRAHAETERIRKETAQIGKPTPRTSEQEAKDKAAAAVATGTVQSEIAKAENEAKEAELRVQEIERRLAQMPTNDQARESTEIALQNARTARDKAQLDLENIRKRAPVDLAQAEATLESTREGTRRQQLGPQYGQAQRIQEIRAMIERGEIDRQQGLAMIRAETAGATPFELQREETRAGEQRTSQLLSQRGQDINDLASQRSTFGSAVTSGLGQFTNMNRDAPPGSDALGKAFLAFMDLIQSKLGAHQTPAAVVQPPASAGSTPATGAGHVTINIGSGAASNPQPPSEQQPASQQALLPAGVAGTSVDPRITATGYQNPVAAPSPDDWLGALRGRLNQDVADQRVQAGVGTYDNPNRPATPEDVQRIWGRTTGMQAA